MFEQGSVNPAPMADQMARASASFDWLTSSDGVLHWVESGEHTGRAIEMSWSPTLGHRTHDSKPPAVRVGSTLHAYGGMPYAVLPSLDAVLVDAHTGQISSDTLRTETAHSYGDLARFGTELLCVRENDSGDELVAIDLASAGMSVLLRTEGFLASPRLHAGRLAWMQWGRDVMPWDSCEIRVADYHPGRQLGRPISIAGGPNESAIQPTWDEDTTLYFLSDRTGWWNLYRWRDGSVDALAPMAAECAAAPWESSYSNYVLLPRGRIGMTVQRGPNHHLVVIQRDGHVTPIQLPYTFIKPYLATLDDRVALIGSSPTRPQEVALVATDGSHHVEVVRASPGSNEERSALSVPEVIRVGSADAEVTVLLYAPTDGGVPAPLIVRPHAGPTYNVDYRLDWEVQFFTSRGFAVADVDYRGSTGYGRAFRKALDGRWGISDAEDCRNVALQLLSSGQAKPGAVFIAGASAGGYTAIRAVCDDDSPFAAAIARSAIVDPQRWMTTAPRFQRPHAAILSHHDAKIDAESIKRPVYLLHDADDKVAPIEDVCALCEKLRALQADGQMVSTRGLGHEISEQEALSAILTSEMVFMRQIMEGYAGPLPEVDE